MKTSNMERFCRIFERDITRYLCCCLALSVIILIPLFSMAGVKGTKHDLSVTGPGPVKAASETEICIFCHTPHNATSGYPLWNHEITTVNNYTNYWSPTLVSYSSPEEAPPVDGFSRLCLSCHDGTVALGATVGSADLIKTSPTHMMSSMGRYYFGTNLSGGMPISIIFDLNLVMERNSEPGTLHLNWPITDKDVKLYPTQGGYGVQCTSCHDPHGGKGGPGAPPFWRKETFDEVCLVCHNAAVSFSH
jgi:predicted CXXCH cytochrome family protein